MMAARSMRLLLREHGACGGAETVNLHLVQEFAKVVDRIVWVMPSWRSEYFQKFFPASERLIYETPSWPRDWRMPYTLEKALRFLLRQKNLPGRFVFEKMRRALSDLWLGRIIRENKITHCFCNWTLSVDAPGLDVPLGAMLMDVRWRYFPETFPDADIERIDRQFCDWLRKSSVVFPISEATASDIKRFYPWYRGQTRVVPHGAESPRNNYAPSATANGPIATRPVFYCPAIAHAHKDHITLLQACAKLLAKGYDFELVLTGLGTDHFDNTHPNNDATIESCRAFLQKQHTLFHGRVRGLGYCDRAEVEALYQSCTAVVLPSFFEGFGLPLLEALQRGAAVICSDIPAHLEQLARYGCVDDVLVAPARDSGGLADQMEKVLIAAPMASSEKRCSSVELERWTWKDAAAAYLESLAAVTPNHSSG
ncbi:MAG: hypothetical protein QOH39_3619 [Verrucomicrobiota bacterium]|jgi:glycosyltransferase involved in cell wall biosynthesis